MLCARYGLRTDAQVAEAFGVERSMVNRIRRGVLRPNASFVAGALRAWRGVRFEELFVPVEREG